MPFARDDLDSNFVSMAEELIVGDCREPQLQSVEVGQQFEEIACEPVEYLKEFEQKRTPLMRYIIPMLRCLQLSFLNRVQVVSRDVPPPPQP